MTSRWKKEGDQEGVREMAEFTTFGQKCVYKFRKTEENEIGREAKGICNS